LKQLILLLFKQDLREISYLPKENVKYNHHHIIKDIDIFFYPSGIILYVAHESSKELLTELVIADYHKFSGTNISVQNANCDSETLKFSFTG
jgi:hypothetical protein